MGDEVRQGDGGPHNLLRLLRRITEEESKKVVITIKDEDGFQGLAEIEQTIRTWTGSSTRFSGMVARPAKNPEKPLHC